MSHPEGASTAGATNEDEYVAQLLAKDARECSRMYSALGVYGMAKRPVNGAPKPNTRFLRHIIHETDTHNTNLKRKEEKEARDRMKQLSREKYSSTNRSRCDEDHDRKSKRRKISSERHGRSGRHQQRPSRSHDRKRDDYSTDDSDTRARRRRRRLREHDSHTESDPRTHKTDRRLYHEDQGHYEHTRNRHESPPSSIKHMGVTTHGHPQSSPGRIRSRSTDRGHRKHHRKANDISQSDDETERVHRHESKHHRRADRSLRSTRDNLPKMSPRNDHSSKLQVISPNSPELPVTLNTELTDSDPLEDLIGPMPRSNFIEPLRSRGRGVYKNLNNSSNIDAHFASGYDPAVDVSLEDDNESAVTKKQIRFVPGLLNPQEADRHHEEDDDWGLALEALRDRAFLRKKGADRLRDAGFEDHIVERWKNNKAFAAFSHKDENRGDISGDDRDIDTVKWSKKGEGREWDRGKVMDEEGNISIRPAW
ncbi:hypothetical protein FQN57_006473 [Myotisia sp. PD_48]|nr:hypothetical protein FQN57_006473 [Myotisia sp. PD_48]